MKLCNEQRVETKNGDRKDVRSGEPSEKGAEWESNRDTVSLSRRSNLIRMKFRSRARTRPRGRPRLPARPVPINGDDQLLRGPPTHPRTRLNTRQATNERTIGSRSGHQFATSSQPVSRRVERVLLLRLLHRCFKSSVSWMIDRRCYSFPIKVAFDRSSQSKRR